jgi:two-component system sensor histidine kinase YesM
MGDKGYVFILDQDGNIVYHPRQQQLYNELQTENISLVMNAGSDIVTVGKGNLCTVSF